MVITIDTAIREKWHRGFDRKGDVTEIVLHATDGGGTYSYVLGGGRKELYVKGVGLFHFLIEPNGKIIEIIDPNKKVYHSSSLEHDDATIGIEIQKNHNSDKPTIDQNMALFFLIQQLLEKFPTIKRINSHDFNRKKFSNLPPKPCPGKFDWDHLGLVLSDYGFKLKTEQELVRA